MDDLVTLDVLVANVVIGGALVSIVCNAYLTMSHLSFLGDLVYDSLELCLACDCEWEVVSCPTLHEHFEWFGSLAIHVRSSEI